MSSEQLPARSKWTAGIAVLAVGLVTAVAVYRAVGSFLFVGVLKEPPLASAVAFPAGVAIAVGIGLTARRVLLGRRWVSPHAVAATAGGVAYIAVGGPLGVYASVSASPFRDLALTVGVALVAGGLLGSRLVHRWVAGGRTESREGGAGRSA